MGNLEETIRQSVVDFDNPEFFDDDIDTIDDEEYETQLEFETDENGNYIRLLDRLTELIPVGRAKPNLNQRAELFHESVVETIMEKWQRARLLKTHLLNGFPYVGIMVDAKIPEIGGFSFKNRKDEQKGTIIECINSGRIVTLVTPELLRRQYFVFLPLASTLASMQEFSLLRNVRYYICFIAKTGEVQLTNIDVSFDAIASMVLNDLHVQDMLVSAMEGYDPLTAEHDYSAAYDDMEAESDYEEYNEDYSEYMQQEFSDVEESEFSGDDDEDMSEFLNNDDE